MGHQTPESQERLGTAGMLIPWPPAVHGKELEHSRDEGQLGALERAHRRGRGPRSSPAQAASMLGALLWLRVIPRGPPALPRG